MLTLLTIFSCQKIGELIQFFLFHRNWNWLARYQLKENPLIIFSYQQLLALFNRIQIVIFYIWYDMICFVLFRLFIILFMMIIIIVIIMRSIWYKFSFDFFPYFINLWNEEWNDNSQMKFFNINSPLLMYGKCILMLGKCILICQQISLEKKTTRGLLNELSKQTAPCCSLIKFSRNFKSFWDLIWLCSIVTKNWF